MTVPHNDDELVAQVSAEWLAQFARFLRRSPELIAKLVERSDDFEFVPVPKMLLDHLAVPGIMSSGSLGGVDVDLAGLLELGRHSRAEPLPTRDPRSLEEALNRVREFAAALQAGDMVSASRLLSLQFLDQDGRDLTEFQNIVRGLVAGTRERTLSILDTQEVRGSDSELVFRVKARWIAVAGDATSEHRVCETVSLEVTMERQSDGDWKIAGLRSV